MNETERAVLAAWDAGWTVTYTRFRLGLGKRQMRAVLLRLGLLTARARPGLEQRCWPATREGRRRWRVRGGGGEARMEAARDEARARIAARMVEESRRGIPVAQGAVQALTGASARVALEGTLAEGRGRRPGGANFARCARRLGGADPDAETFLDRAVRRVEADRLKYEAACWHRTPRPGEGRAT